MLSLLFILAIPLPALGGDRPEIKLWPTGLPSDARPISEERIEQLLARQTPERLTYVSEPSLTVFRAPIATANGCCVIVCPGGGYNILAWPKEGLELAELVQFVWCHRCGAEVSSAAS